MTTVLFTCAGQRVDVVEAFRAAGAVTVAADLNPLAPALHHADVGIAPPPCDDPDYPAFLAATVAEHDVRLIVPLTDLDQRLLAERREELGGLVLLPSPEVVERTNDKYLAHHFFAERGIDSPPTWLPGELPRDLPFPVLVKPRRGFGSRNIYRARGPGGARASCSTTRPRSRWCSACARERSSRSTSSATSRGAA